jgi:hypothetical protein
VTVEINPWRYDRHNLIDDHALMIDEPTMAGLRARSVRLARNSDHLALMLLVQNTTNDTLGLGQTHAILAAFTFPHGLGRLDDRAYTGLMATLNLHQRTKRT